MVKINGKIKEQIKSILFSRIDSQGQPNSSPQSVHQEILNVLHPAGISFGNFRIVLERFKLFRRENPQEGFKRCIEFLEYFVDLPHKTKTTDRKKHPQIRLDDRDRLMATARHSDYT